MATDPSILYSQQYTTNVALLLQQKISKFRGAVTEGGYTGKQASPVDQIGAVDMQPVTSRFAVKTQTEMPVDRRWVRPSDFDLTLRRDTFDQLKGISDPRGPFTQAGVAGVNRKYDDLVIAALGGTAFTGEVGGTSTILPTSTSTNVVSVSTGGTTSGMNVAKLKLAYQYLLQAFVETETDPIYCCIKAAQNTDLLNEIQIISADFKAEQRPRVENGKVMEFLGIQFIHSQRLTDATDDVGSTTSTQCYMWAKSGMHLGIWDNMTTDIRQAKELKGNPWEVYLFMSAGATRLEEGKVVKIWAR